MWATNNITPVSVGTSPTLTYIDQVPSPHSSAARKRQGYGPATFLVGGLSGSHTGFCATSARGRDGGVCWFDHQPTTSAQESFFFTRSGHSDPVLRKE